jgi:hypothetical protein
LVAVAVAAVRSHAGSATMHMREILVAILWYSSLFGRDVVGHF